MVAGQKREMMAPMTHNETDGNDSDGVECPTCGEDGFDGEGGMKIHHAHAHNETIGRTTLECEICGEEFTVKDARSDTAQFCSNECRGEWITTQGGDDHPLADRKDIECVVCGKTRSVPKSYPESVRTCGAAECVSAYKSEIMPARESHPLWNGGYENYYGPNWEAQSEKARERDNYTCQACGVTESEYWRNLDVHHIKRKEWFVENCGDEWWKEANGLDNLVTLCMSCHAEWEGIPIRPKIIEHD